MDPNTLPAPGAPSDAGTGGQAPQGTQPPALPAPQQPAGQAPAQQPQQGTDPQAIDSLPDWAQKQIRDLRAENATHRTGKQTATQQAQAAQEKLTAVLKAAGLNPDGTEAAPDPAALAQQLEERTATAWVNAVELAVFRTASAAGANADALLDSRTFIDSLDALSDVDPASAEFKTKLDAHVRQYVKDHPQYTTQPAGPARSGGDHPGGGGAPTNRPKSLAAAIKARLGTQ